MIAADFRITARVLAAYTLHRVLHLDSKYEVSKYGFYTLELVMEGRGIFLEDVWIEFGEPPEINTCAHLQHGKVMLYVLLHAAEGAFATNSVNISMVSRTVID